MFITEIKIMQRRNLGNYEHREVTMGISLVEGDSLEAAKSLLNKEVLTALGYSQKAEEAQAPKKEEEEVKEEVKEEKKKSKKSAPKKEKVEKEVIVPTLQEMMDLCRETAGRLKTADKVKALIQEICAVDSLSKAEESTYIALKKALLAA